jgi:hypothetical protein
MDWRALKPADAARAGCPLRMPAESIAAPGLPACSHCGAPIQAGELFLLSGRCAMGGAVTGPGAALYSDVLEPEQEHVRCAAAARGAPDPLCCTVGHGTRTLEEFLSLLREQDVRLLADIRTVPRSRSNPQFAGETLARSLPGAGVCYLHLRGLGGYRKPRADSPNGGWRNDSFRGYADYMLTPDFEAALAELIALLRLQRTAIMCAETVYWRCHRSLVADALLTRGIESKHLMAPGKTVPHTLTRFARPEGTRLLYPPEDSSA